MAIDRETVLHVARLARLDLREDEVDRLTTELGAILDAVSKVAELDLADVPPTSHPLDLVNVWADDEPRPSLSARRGARQRSRPRGRPLPRAAHARPRGVARDRHAAPHRRGGARPARAARGLVGRAPRAPTLAAAGRARRRAARLPPARRVRRGHRRADRAQGRDLDQGRRDDGRLEDPRRLRAGLRLHRRGALQGGGHAA